MVKPREKPIVSLLGIGDVPTYKRRFLCTPDFKEQEQILKGLSEEGIFEEVPDAHWEQMKASLSQEGSFWYRNSSFCHYEWDAESLAESSIDRFINNYLYPFISRLQVQVQVGSEGGISSKEKIISAADDWLYRAEINNVEWWLFLESEETSAQNDWHFRISRYVQSLNIISALSNSDFRLYYEDQGDEVVFIILSQKMHDKFVQWKLLGYANGSDT